MDLRQIHSVQRVGAETARLCVALGMTVISIDPRPEHEFPGAIHAPFALGDLLRDADLVVATAPHTPETEFMWNMERFRRMKPSAYFINIGRAMLPLSRGLRPAPIRFNEAPAESRQPTNLPEWDLLFGRSGENHFGVDSADPGVRPTDPRPSILRGRI